jgi:6-phosphogluconolactonase
MARIIIERAAAAVADRAASIVTAAMNEADGPFTLGLAGGSTPVAIHERLARARVDWSVVRLWLGDERWVPPDDQESNARMARETFADVVKADLFAPDTLAASPDESAIAYERELERIWVPREGGAVPDLVMLGIGDDGHTASLFPGTSALEITDRTYVANHVPQKETWRLTATFDLLWSARMLLFVVVGRAKARAVREMLDEGLDHPARRVSEGSGNAVWVLDRAAASQLGSV